MCVHAFNRAPLTPPCICSRQDGCQHVNKECLQRCWQSNSPRVTQPGPVQINVLLIPVWISPVWLVLSRKRVCMQVWRTGPMKSKGWGGEEAGCCSSVLIHLGFTPTHTEKEKGHLYWAAKSLFWRQNNFQNVTLLLGGKVSIEGRLNFQENVWLTAIFKIGPSNFKKLQIRFILKVNVCRESPEPKQTKLLKQFWDERLKSETYQQPWGNTHTTTTIQGEGCYRSQVYSRQTNKGSRFLCNGSLEFSTAQHSTTQLRGSLVFSERRGPNNTRIKPNTKEPVSIFKLDKYVLTYMQTGTILQNDCTIID